MGEEDDHFATLSVAQTLRFALRTKVPNRQSRGGLSRDEFIEQLVDVYLNMFGMPHVKDTIVGNDFVRGVRIVFSSLSVVNGRANTGI